MCFSTIGMREIRNEWEFRVEFCNGESKFRMGVICIRESWWDNCWRKLNKRPDRTDPQVPSVSRLPILQFTEQIDFHPSRREVNTLSTNICIFFKWKDNKSQNFPNSSIFEHISLSRTHTWQKSQPTFTPSFCFFTEGNEKCWFRTFVIRRESSELEDDQFHVSSWVAL